jgi:coenzyme F420-reducing hydrogenase gamma subunit
MPSSQRNQFDPQKQAEIAFLVARFKMAEKVKKLEDVISVDAKVNGCPMDETVFLKIINQYLQEFKISA